MKIIFSLLFLISLSGCFKKSRPHILSQHEMEKVIWDIMLVEEFANIKAARDSLKNIDKERLNLYMKVFQLHRISREDFSASLKYYAAKPGVMKTIFDTLSAKKERERRIPLKAQ